MVKRPILTTITTQEFSGVGCAENATSVSEISGIRSKGSSKPLSTWRSKHREEDIDTYYEKAVEAAGGKTRRIIYRGRKGCADHLTGFPFNRLFLVELKRPKGGKISIQQEEDMRFWLALGVRKEFIFTKSEVDSFIKRVTHSRKYSFMAVHTADCICDTCVPFF